MIFFFFFFIFSFLLTINLKLIILLTINFLPPSSPSIFKTQCSVHLIYKSRDTSKQMVPVPALCSLAGLQERVVVETMQLAKKLKNRDKVRTRQQGAPKNILFGGATFSTKGIFCGKGTLNKRKFLLVMKYFY